jgi:hypothetical protein
VSDTHWKYAPGRKPGAGREPVRVAQKDESLIEEMREQLRSDRERATRRAPVLPHVEPAPEPAAEPEPQRSTFGDRLRRAFKSP